MKRNQNPLVVEFRSWSFFRGPRAEHGGTIGQAMRFNQEKHARRFLDTRADWAWLNRACILERP